jgi:hypothetical protein
MIMYARSLSIVAIALTAGLAAAPVAAQQKNAPAAEPEAIGGADAEFARAALFYSPASGIIRSTGVVTVNRVSTGTYCIKTDVRVDKTVPAVSVEWGESSGDGLLAFWRWNAFDCPNDRRWVEVRTFAFGLLSPSLSDDVAFTLTVP